MKIAILGYGLQGKSAYEYWDNQENEITICDSNEFVELPKNVSSKLGVNYLENLDEFDVIVRSPSVLPDNITEHNGSKITQKATSSTNEFFKVCPSKNIIGVTGTKGKGTTTTLLAKMLEKAGKRVHVGGNIGTPPLDLLKDQIKEDDWVVLELANFQLIDLKYSPKIAVCLMIAPEHLDWHASESDYYQSKKQLFKFQTEDDVAVYFADNDISNELASSGNAKLIPFFAKPGSHIKNNKLIIDNKTVCSTNDFKLLGKHNWQNICAASTAFWQIIQDIDSLKHVVANFSGLPYRLEFRREVNGVKYYNDSFGTTPETAIVAIKAFNQPKIVILGGSDKGSKYKELAKVVANNNVKKVILIGKMAKTIQQELDKVGFTDYIQGGRAMPEIVQAAREQSASGDVILLSTACASFGMFENYKDRGDQFNQAVQALA